jgi:hypothetical protein
LCGATCYARRQRRPRAQPHEHAQGDRPGRGGPAPLPPDGGHAHRRAVRPPGLDFEPKLDGLRILARFDGRGLTLLSRNNKPQEAVFPDVSAALRTALKRPSVVDGEVVCFDAQGRTSFRALQQRFHLLDPAEVRARAQRYPASIYLFDMLWLAGRDLTGEPLSERKRLLREAVRWSDRVRWTEYEHGKGKALFREACQRGAARGVIAAAEPRAYTRPRQVRNSRVKEHLMDATSRTSPALQRDARRTGRGLRSLPALAVVALVALSLYASQAAVRPPREAVQPGLAAGADRQKTPAEGRTPRAVEAANAFLKSLDATQRARALLAFDSPKKPNWSNLPVTMVPRNGVRLGDLSREQRDAAMRLLAAVLSEEGYRKVVGIMEGDQVLAASGGGKGGKGKGKGGKGKGGGPMFGQDLYYLALFGEPSATRPWMVQFGGHHLGLNVTVVGKDLVLTPTHTGVQPASFTWEGKEVRPLGPENDRAFRLVNALDDRQRAQAVLGDRPGNLILGPGEDGKKIQPQGVKGSALTDGQRAMLLDLIAAWVNLLSGESASARLAEIKGALPDTYFAWRGPTAKGSAVYFRVQGPTLVIEYAPQGSTSHIHTIIRNPVNDYGEKLTRR